MHAQFSRVVTALEAKLPAAAEHLAGAREDLLAFTTVPAKSGAKSGRTTRYLLTGSRATRFCWPPEVHSSVRGRVDAAGYHGR